MSGHAATYINSSSITTTDGTNYIIDFGSQHSFLADTTVRRILGTSLDTHAVPTLAYAVCPDGKGRMFDIKYSHQVTLSDPEDGNPVTLSNSEFLSYPGCDENIIGMDILHSFIVEYIYDEQIVIFHNTIPEGYVKLGDITHKGSSLTNLFTHGNSYYIDLTVDHHISKSFHIDTGHEMSGMYITLPPSDADPDTNLDLTQPHECWVDIESRAGSSLVNYINMPLIDPYSINPFTFFEQDFLIAFPENEIYLHPTTSYSQNTYISQNSNRTSDVSY